MPRLFRILFTIFLEIVATIKTHNHKTTFLTAHTSPNALPINTASITTQNLPATLTQRTKRLTRKRVALTIRANNKNRH
jgi:hypothetical protein